MRIVHASPEELSKRKTYHGWYISARGPNFVFYRYISDNNNWGNIDLTPGKKSGFVVLAVIVRNGKRKRYREVVESFRLGNRVVQRLLCKYAWYK